jgi:hypothetical protein
MADIDDGSIADDDALLRRIHPTQVVEDKNLNRTRPSSGAFDDPTLSVDVERVLVENDLNWGFCLKNHPGYSLVKFEARVARARGLAVVSKPLDDDPAHAEVQGKKTPSIQKSLYLASNWVHLEKPKT